MGDNFLRDEAAERGGMLTRRHGEKTQGGLVGGMPRTSHHSFSADLGEGSSLLRAHLLRALRVSV